MNGVILGLMTAVFYAFQQFFAAKGLQKIDKYLFLLFGNLLMVFLLFLTALNSDFTVPPARIWIVLFFLGIIGSLALLSFYKSLEIGNLVVISPIVNSFSLVTIALSIIFLGEPFSTLKILAVILIILGIILVSFRLKDIKSLKFKSMNEGIIFAFMTFFGWGIYYFLQKPVVDELGPALSAFYVEAAIILFSFMIFSGKIRSIRKLKFEKGGVKYLLLSAFFVTLAALSFSFGINNEDVSIVGALSSLTPIFVLVLSMIFKKDDTELNQKVGIFLSVAGVVLLSI